MQLIYNKFFKVYSGVSRKHRNKKHRGIRWLTPINNRDDARLVRLFLDEGVRVRHIDYLPLPSFALSDKMLNSTIEKMEDGKMVTTLLSSNDSLYLNHYNTMFKVSWKTGIDAEQRIADIEKGYYSNTRIIPNPKESYKIISKLVDSVNDEVLIMVPSENGFSQLETADSFKVLNDLASKEIKVKVLHVSMDNEKQNTFQKIKLKYPHIEFRSLHTTFQPIIRITVLDREKTILMEIRNDTCEDYLDAVGLSLFIESKYTALSYVAIFNNLWNQSEMYEKLQEAYELLTLHDKMKNEFIGLVAHELRTPITPIIGLTEHLRDKLTDSKKKLLDVVINDSKKLQTLTEKILDVTRIEGRLFELEKKRFSLNQLILDIVRDFENNSKDKDKKNQIKFEFDNSKFSTKNYFVIADKIKIGQVISNLIENSIKFLSYERKGKEENVISITVKKKESFNDPDVEYKKGSFIIVSIKDNGSGIDDEIFPRLFTKFASKSFHGTGLGLYLSKNIVEAHGGVIWGDNNKDSRGATFSFGLPLND
jgi:signal transduction histidine kinase